MTDSFHSPSTLEIIKEVEPIYAAGFMALANSGEHDIRDPAGLQHVRETALYAAMAPVLREGRLQGDAVIDEVAHTLFTLPPYKIQEIAEGKEGSHSPEMGTLLTRLATAEMRISHLTGVNSDVEEAFIGAQTDTVPLQLENERLTAENARLTTEGRQKDRTIAEQTRTIEDQTQIIADGDTIMAGLLANLRKTPGQGMAAAGDKGLDLGTLEQRMKELASRYPTSASGNENNTVLLGMPKVRDGAASPRR